MKESATLETIVGWPVNLNMDGKLFEGHIISYDPETGYGEVETEAFVFKLFLGLFEKPA